MNTKEQNQKSLYDAITTLKQVSMNFSTPKTIRKSITDLANELTNDNNTISVRAANAISTLDEITQDPNLPSHVRVNIWQAVSILERIRE